MAYNIPGDKHQDKLEEIKKKIEESHQYWLNNANRFNEFTKFTFCTSLTSDDEKKLMTLGKPAIQFNILEAMVSRLLGEFSKQEPSLEVRASDGVTIEQLTPEFTKTIEVLEAHLRMILLNSTNDNLAYRLYKDELVGGYSVAKVYTDYINDMSFEQNICVERVFDPTLTGFDPLARLSHKGDGSYCFELIPKTKDEFIKEFGEAAAKDIKFARSSDIGGFNWSYRNQKVDIILVADYYFKKKKRVKIVKLSNGHTVSLDQYKKFLAVWDATGKLEQPPVVLDERYTNIETICRYRLCQTTILDYVETSFKYLPLVFFDGSSVYLRGSDDSSTSSSDIGSTSDASAGSVVQMTRPFVYHAKGIQKLKNFAGQTIANELENMLMHKLIASAESIPEDYQHAYSHPQEASVIVYNQFYEKNPEIPLTPPREVVRTPTPPIVEQTFMNADRETQAILGSYDAILGISGNQISGVAIQQGAMQSNAAALPFLEGYVSGLNRIAQIMLDLIPKFYVTPRSLPIIKSDGKKSYQLINQPNQKESVQIDYDVNSLQVKIEAGVNSAVQKQVALDQIIKLTQASPLFAEFINTMGLETILDNMDIRGIDHLKQQSVIFMQQKQQAAQQAMQKPNEIELLVQAEMAKVQQRKEEAEGNQAIKAAEVALDQQKVDIDFMKVAADIGLKEAKLGIEQERIDAENARSAIDVAMNIVKQHSEISRQE